LNEVFAKTQKGIAEIENRGRDITLRMRRILIQVDGNKTVEEITEEFGESASAGDLINILGELHKNGYIGLVSQHDKNPLINEDEPETGINFSFRKIPSSPNSKDIEKAKNFMINTIRVYCGEWAHLSIIKAVSAANTHEELRKSFIPWYEAIIETGDGRRRSEELSSSLLNVI